MKRPRKFVPGDRVICTRKDFQNRYTYMPGTVTGFDTQYKCYNVRIDVCPLSYGGRSSSWSFVEDEMRHMTKLEKALK